VCARCCNARYCGQDCQTRAWEQHQAVCQAYSADAAATKVTAFRMWDRRPSICCSALCVRVCVCMRVYACVFECVRVCV
jgi:hypothetical protein